jgi:hypothetical protein
MVTTSLIDRARACVVMVLGAVSGAGGHNQTFAVVAQPTGGATGIITP